MYRVHSVDENQLERAFKAFTAAKQNADQANERLKHAEHHLLNQLRLSKRKTFSQSEDGFTFSATYTQRTTTEVDEKSLRKALTARVFDRYTVKKLDRKALEQAMETGQVDPMIVAQHVTQTPGKTFLTYRVKEDKVEEA